MFKTNNRPDTFSGTFVIVSVLSSETTKYFPTVSKELKSVPSGIFPLFGNKLLIVRVHPLCYIRLSRKNYNQLDSGNTYSRTKTYVFRGDNACIVSVFFIAAIVE